MTILHRLLPSRIAGEREIIDPFADPVAYLAAFGIDSELVEVRLDVSEAA
jgi:hypothetical protein